MRINWDDIPDVLRRPHIEVVGVSLLGPAPLGHVHVEWREGLNVLYGVNGAGKSRVLSGIRSALRGVGEHDTAMVHVRLLDPEESFDWDYEYPAIALLGALHEGLVKMYLDPVGSRLFYNMEAQGIWSQFDEFLGAATPREATLQAIKLAALGSSTYGAAAESLASLGMFTLVASGRETPEFRVFVSAPAGTEASGLESLRREAEKQWAWPWDRFPEPGDDERIPRLTRQVSDGDPPAWVPIPWLEFGRLKRSYWPVLTERPGELRESTQELLATATEGMTSLNGTESDDTREETTTAMPEAILNELAAAVSTEANEYLALLLHDAPVLDLVVRNPAEWLKGDPAMWTAIDGPTLTAVELHDLSRAQRRWASFAAQMAVQLALHESASIQVLNDPDPQDPQSRAFSAVALMDEPESALHLNAIRRVTEGLAELGSGAFPAFVATHSPIVLNHPDARLLHVARDDDGLSEVRSWSVDDGPSIDEIAEGLELSRSDLLQLVRVFMFVEGAHDEAAFSVLLGEELASSRVRVVPFRGTKKLEPHVLDNAILLEMTDAAIVVVLDNIRHPDQLEDAWQEAVRSAAAGEALAAERRLKEAIAKDTPTSEEGQAVSFLVKSLQSGLGHRVTLVGMSMGDIEFYFPADLFGAPTGVDWEILRREHEKAKSDGLRNVSFKDWVRDHKKMHVTVGAVRAAAEEADEIHPDFNRVLKAARNAAGGILGRMRE